MTLSRFIRHVPFQVDRWWGDAVHLGGRATQNTPPGPGGDIRLRSRFIRKVAVQPSPFQIDYPIRRPIPDRAEPECPVRVNVFLARVDDQLGELQSLTLWELPSWRELESTLEPGKLDRTCELEGPDPLPGDLLWIWTWTDLPRSGTPIDRIYVKTERRTLDEEERQAARDTLEALRAAREEDPRGPFRGGNSIGTSQATRKEETPGSDEEGAAG